VTQPPETPTLQPAPTGPITEFLDDGAVLERVATGASWAEGPVWLPERRQVWFSDIKGNRILAFDEASGELSVAVAEAEYPNGRTLDGDGRIVQCSHGRRRVEIQELDGSTTGLVERIDGEEGPRFNSPNDVVVAADGAVWFTDPAYGIQSAGEGHPGEMEYGGTCHVFRLDRSSGEVHAVVEDMHRPNGLAFSLDERLLYVADSASDLGRPEEHAIRVYDVADGRCTNGRTFAVIEPGVPDGIRVDRQGRVWTSRADGVAVYDPDGTEIAHLPVPETVANLCPGGEDRRSLYLTATTSLYRIRLRDAF